jgi:hypothetical protein
MRLMRGRKCIPMRGRILMRLMRQYLSFLLSCFWQAMYPLTIN